MSDGKRKDAWDRAASTQAAIFNSQRTKKQHAISPRSLNPFTAARHKKATAIRDPRMLAAMCGVT